MKSNEEIIISGFGPFGDISSNPTEKLIDALKEELQDELYQLYVLPVSYDYCLNWSQEYISDSTSLVIHFGVSAKSKIIQLERTGRNVIGSGNDVEGVSLREKISDDGPALIQSKLDLDLVCIELNSRGMPCEVSDNAGDYLCNFILYKSLLVAQEKTVFVHVPPEDEVPLEELKKFTLELIRSLRSQVN